MSKSCAQLYSLEGSPVSLELIMVIYNNSFGHGSNSNSRVASRLKFNSESFVADQHDC